MAEPPITMGPAEASAERAAEPDVLLATKLHVPPPRPGFLARPRLLERLAAGMARELTPWARWPVGRDATGSS